MNREYHHWLSPSLDRTMELLVFGHSGARVIVFPTRTGRFFDYENWHLVESLREKIENGHLQLFCVDSVDAESFYCDSCPPKERMKRHLQYEQYILDEIVPFTELKNTDPCLIAHGCSLGAYHALNIALRHPCVFNKVVGFSGRYDISGDIGCYRDLFDGYRDENIYLNNPSEYLSDLSDPALLEQLRKLEIIITIGKEDILLENNRSISNTLSEKGILNQFHIWDGNAHQARCWRLMVNHYL